MVQTTVMVIGADRDVRRKLMGVVDLVDNMNVVAEAETGPEAITSAQQVKPYVVLIDLGDAEDGDFDLVSQIREAVPGLAVVVTASRSDPDAYRLAMKVGAKELLVRPFPDQELVDALQLASIEAHRNAAVLRPAASPTHGGDSGVDVNARRGKIITICGLKGGVGKTSFAVNMAIAILRQSGKSVALVDFDLQKGDVAIMLNLHATQTLADIVEEPGPWRAEDIASYLTPHESGLEVLPAPARPEQAEAIGPDHVAEVLTLLQDSYDYIIVDTASAVRDLELTIYDLSLLMCVVLNLELPAIKNTKELMRLLKVLKYPVERIKLILNQGFPPLQGIDVQSVQNGLRREVFGLIPSAGSEVVRALSKGKPFMLGGEKTDLTKAYEAVAVKLLEEVS